MDLSSFAPQGKTPDEIKAVQLTLKEAGFYHAALDGIWGRLSAGALNTWKTSHGVAGKFLHGDGSWPWFAEVDGADIVVLNARATAFGGDDDRMDSGETASGYNTKGHPNLIAVSLPMNVPAIKELRGSPIPRMPFGIHPDGSDNPAGAHVDVTFLKSGVVAHNVPVCDLGPAKATGHALDCSVALARRVDPHATANDFAAMVSYRILKAAKFVS